MEFVKKVDALCRKYAVRLPKGRDYETTWELGTE
jgi:hypothetical protein